MTDNFEKRTKAFEDKESYERELHFKNKVEAVRRLGAWASSRFGFDDQTTYDYTQNLIDNCLVVGGVKKVIEAMVVDFKQYGFSEDEAIIEHKLRTYLNELDIEDGLTTKNS